TGPPAHLDRLQARARARGLDWSQLTAPDESAVYRRLGWPEVPPEARDWFAGDARSLDDLITEADIRGVVHCHTDQSDGRHTLEQMARAADARGLRYLTVTDHS